MVQMAYQELHGLSLGLDSNSMLYLRYDHRSTAIWEWKDPSLIKGVNQYHMQKWTLDERVGDYMVR